jgi:ribulose-phosphate 3-epimerase
MQHTIKIAPSMLSCDFANLQHEVERCNKSGVDVIHIDVMDGHFVPNITIGPLIVAAIKPWTDIPLDCHLMIEHPDLYIEDFVKAGADMISVHCEGAAHLHRTISLIKSYGIDAGVALNPVTPLEYAYEVAEFINFILLMSVNPGFGGQSFIPSFIRKCKKLRNFLDANTNTQKVEIQVDGGIKASNLKSVIESGANIIVSGSGLFNGDFPENVLQFKKIINECHS